MEITEVRVRLVKSSTDKLQAFCCVTFDDEFVVRDLKIIGGPDGPFVAMPSRKLTQHCPKCSCKNYLRAKYCNDCGCVLSGPRTERDTRGRPRYHADVAHPIHAACRDRIQKTVLSAFETEVERSAQPGYIPSELHEMAETDDRADWS